MNIGTNMIFSRASSSTNDDSTDDVSTTVDFVGQTQRNLKFNLMSVQTTPIETVIQQTGMDVVANV